MMVAAGTLLKGGTYRIEELIAQGGFGYTYRARDLALDREVAVKAYQGDELPSFLEEARVLASFNHPGIVRVHAVFEENGAGFLVMELLQGEDLLQRVEREGPLPKATAVAYIQQAAQHLAVLHARDVIHRDLKPGNLFCKQDNRIVLLDFGSARSLQQARHTAIVTPGYAPPEQYGHSLKPGPWTDLYALAASLVHLVTGAPPPDVVERLRQDTFKLPDGLPEMVGKALRLSPAERPQSVSEFLAGLSLAAASVVAPKPTAAPASGSPTQLVATTPSASTKPVAKGHQGRVTALTYHGELLASAGEDRQVLLWTTGTPRLHHAHQDWVNALAFSEQGVLASGGNDREMYAGTPVSLPKEILSLAWSGNDLYAGLREGRIARLRNGQLTLFQPGTRGNICALAALEKGWLAVAASPSKKLYLYHPDTGKLEALEGHRASLRCLAHCQGKVVSGDADGHLFLWSNGALEKKWKAHHGAVHAVSFLGTAPVSASQDGSMAVWGPTEKRREFQSGELTALAVSSRGTIAVGTQDGSILFPQTL